MFRTQFPQSGECCDRWEGLTSFDNAPPSVCKWKPRDILETLHLMMEKLFFQFQFAVNETMWRKLTPARQLYAYKNSRSAVIISVLPLVFCARANPFSMNRRDIQTVKEVDSVWGRVQSRRKKRELSRICLSVLVVSVHPLNPRMYIRGQAYGVQKLDRERIRTCCFCHLLA